MKVISLTDMSKRRPWNEKEIAACVKAFKRYIARGKIPGKYDVEKKQDNVSILRKRSWKQIKDYVRNQIVRNKMMKKSKSKYKCSYLSLELVIYSIFIQI